MGKMISRYNLFFISLLIIILIINSKPYDYLMGEKDKISDMLKSREGVTRYQDRLLRGHYGVYA